MLIGGESDRNFQAAQDLMVKLSLPSERYCTFYSIILATTLQFMETMKRLCIEVKHEKKNISPESNINWKLHIAEIKHLEYKLHLSQKKKNNNK